MRSFEMRNASDDSGPAEADRHVFGSTHQHKSAKTLIGIAVLIAASILFYELGANAIGDTSPVGTHRFANSSHR